MPVSFLVNSYLFTQYDFRLRETLQTGEFVFKGNTISEFGYNGFALGNSIVYDQSFQNNSRFYTIINHELVHIYQHNDFNPINAILFKPISDLRNKSKFLNKMSPFIHYDLNLFLNSGVRYFEEINSGSQVDNFFEFEAYYFSDDLGRFR